MQYRKLRIDYVDDCGPNEGGYYCQVYREADEVQIDDPEDFIQSYIDDMYDAYRREGLLNEQSFPGMTM